VPEITRSPPGVSVEPGAMMNSVVPSATVAEMGELLTVKTGRPALRRWVCPLMTTLEPWKSEGRLKVVPSTVTALPGASV
jgi:hypothetical protein